ncbi:MAG: YkgJ family cysteine cluster protein [Nanoarchaeota archaeon]|nr:YkgJ family cysteine cluster protein [Nanoarchaeota archaeon]MBU1004817.1 YkgJ family cysteine cluster protein [Nanoarchaeota archaeon]MBU1946610.1 YkgJ family cysteine cluster protein [Nanoarchaeota archaeon]
MQITKQTKLSEALKLGTKCSRNNNCCKHGSGCLINDDIKKISKFLGITEEKLIKEYLDEKELFNTKVLKPKLNSKDKPYGECIFFDQKGCKIHEVKPLQCRVGNCSEHGEGLSIWFMLNYFVNKDDPESIRQYHTYLNSGGKTIKGGKLEDLVPDKEKLSKILSFDILK